MNDEFYLPLYHVYMGAYKTILKLFLVDSCNFVPFGDFFSSLFISEPDHLRIYLISYV